LGVEVEQFKAIPKSQKVKITSSMGPHISSREVEEYSITSKNPLIGLVFGPGVHRSLAFAYFLNVLLRSDINVAVTSGWGMGAVVASHFARGSSPEKLEWLFYKHFNETKGERVFSRPWKKSIREFFIEEFKGSTIQGQSLTLVIPLFDPEIMKVRSFDRGDLYSSLKAQFDFFNPNDLGQYTTPLQEGVYDFKFLEKYGVDIVIGIDVLKDNIAFEKDHGFFLGLFGKIAGKKKLTDENLDLSFSLPVSHLPLDFWSFPAEDINLIKTSSEGFVSKIKDYIASWKKTQEDKSFK
jgi:hypothetical protein